MLVYLFFYLHDIMHILEAVSFIFEVIFVPLSFCNISSFLNHSDETCLFFVTVSSNQRNINDITIKTQIDVASSIHANVSVEAFDKNKENQCKK